MEERALTMVLHSLIIGLVLYILMIYVLKQNYVVAETRSVFISGLVLIYMVMFGHKLPGKVNKLLF
jgi:hypothetical protein